MLEEKVRELRGKGYGYKRIAMELNISPDSVRYQMKKLGLTGKLKAQIIRCESCGKEVKTVRHNAKFCSDKCRLRARKIRAKGRKKCSRCGDPINGLQNVKYCSDDCRKKSVLSRRTLLIHRIKCFSCDTSLLVRHKRKYCTNKCYYHKLYRKKVANKALHSLKCKECGKHFSTTNQKRLYCSNKCGRKFQQRKRDFAKRKKIVANGRVDWAISIERLSMRDGRHCYICGDLMNYKVDYNDDNYPNIEHVKPISKGGTHTWDNVKLAHRKCNMDKSDEWFEI